MTRSLVPPLLVSFERPRRRFETGPLGWHARPARAAPGSTTDN